VSERSNPLPLYHSPEYAVHRSCRKPVSNLKPSNFGALVWGANVSACHLDSNYATAAISHRDALLRPVKYASSSVIARRSHSNACSKSVHF
jgi:hypothetical protein